MNTGLAGKVAVVTGASGGIGSALARSLAGEGARLALHYNSNRAGVESLQKELKPCESIIIRADLTQEAQVRRLFAETKRRLGRVDTLVVNAGAWEKNDVPLHKMDLRQWRATLDGVLTSAFLCLREFFILVEKQRSGNAVLIASTAGIFGEAGHADYAAAKAAMAHGLTRSLKNEIARIAPHTRDYCGGRINCVCPGWTIVPRNAAKLEDAKIVRKVTATMSLPKVARPQDIAGAVTFLASDTLAGHVTGQTIVVAGGMEGRVLWQPEEIDPSLA